MHRYAAFVKAGIVLEFESEKGDPPLLSYYIKEAKWRLLG